MASRNRNGGGGEGRQQEEKAAPVYSRRYWTGSGTLEIAGWSRMIGEGKDAREVVNFTVKKTYKDGDDYKQAGSYRPEELPQLAQALNQAFAWAAEQANRE